MSIDESTQTVNLEATTYTYPLGCDRESEGSYCATETTSARTIAAP
ncbi:MAG: hypothetical protein JW797_03475 [Bradymonadales bacterium]|nr:hypothetical protein [Bradymonadales bacterium]